MATFNQEPAGQAQVSLFISSLSILNGGTGVVIYDPNPPALWPVVNDDQFRTTRSFFSFSLVSFVKGPQAANATINDVYLAYLTFECPPCPPCPPVPTYSASGQRWPWGYGPSA